MKHFPSVITFLALASCLCSFTQAQQKRQADTVTVTGLIIPRDSHGIFVRNREGQFPIAWDDKTRVALEVNTRLLKGHPEIAVCDQWQFVKDHEDDTYQKWWTGKNVHFKGRPSDALGELLAEHVRKVPQDN